VFGFDGTAARATVLGEQDVRVEWMIRDIKDNPDVFTALVALIAVLGGIVGSYIGARVQAASGRAQANAATDAARIMVQYQHLASLHTDRRTVLADFLHQTEAAMDAIEKSLVDGSDYTAAVQVTHTTIAELELILPAGIREAALLLHRKVIGLDAFVAVRGSAIRRRQRYLGSNRDAAARQALDSLQLGMRPSRKSGGPCNASRVG
jgi:hypothetical protein